jgi:hypothetical protein
MNGMNRTRKGGMFSSKFYTNAQSGTLKRIDLVKSIVHVILDSEFIVHNNTALEIYEYLKESNL